MSTSWRTLCIEGVEALFGEDHKMLSAWGLRVLTALKDEAEPVRAVQFEERRYGPIVLPNQEQPPNSLTQAFQKVVREQPQPEPEPPPTDGGPEPNPETPEKEPCPKHKLPPATKYRCVRRDVKEIYRKFGRVNFDDVKQLCAVYDLQEWKVRDLVDEALRGEPIVKKNGEMAAAATEEGEE